MKPEPLHVAVCVPSNGLWRARTGKCLALMFAHASERHYLHAPSQRVSIIGGESSMLCQNRQTMAQVALQGGASHIMFVDTDMIFPMNTLERLLKARKAFVAANCTTRAEPCVTVAHTLQGERLRSIGVAGLERVQHVGLAVALIRREVFEKTVPPHFLMDWIPQIKAYCGEDTYFCQKIQAAGFDCWVDHDLSHEVYHIGDREFGHRDVDYGDA